MSKPVIMDDVDPDELMIALAAYDKALRARGEEEDAESREEEISLHQGRDRCGEESQSEEEEET